jgi:hypothetical protein
VSRTLPTGLNTALTAVTVAPVFLVELAWPNTTIRLWNGYHTLAWNSVNWSGVGHLGGISEVKESSDLSATGTVLTLSGIPSSLISEVLRNDALGCPAKIYFGVLTAAGFSIDPYLVFDGMMDAPNISSDGNTSTITLPLEKELIDNRGSARRYTHEDQQIDYPGDLGLEYVAGLQNKDFTWGKATIYAGGGAGGGGSDDGDPNLQNQP